MSSRPPQITDSHLRRRVLVYVRQSSEEQVRQNVGSTAVQRELPSLLQSWGWPPDLIEVIDEDLGVSGTVPSLRHGFNSVVERMATGTIGMVAVSDISRLIRNDPDLAKFAAVAPRHDVLLLHGGQITDFRDPNSAFIGWIMGHNAGRETRTRLDFARRARRKKAEDGKAPTSPPVGYIRLPDSTWVKDRDDDRVREVIQLVFDKFLELGSLGRVLQYFRANGIQLPGRGRRGYRRWANATRAKIHRILRHPAYAGVYEYGRTAVDYSRDPDAKGRRRPVPTPGTSWVRIPDHHEPYLPPHLWAQIQQRLTANRKTLRGPAGRGETLVRRLLQCTIHGGIIKTTYPSRARVNGRLIRLGCYGGHPADGTKDRTRCGQAASRLVDHIIESELLRRLVPPTVETLKKAAREALREHEALERLRQDELRRAKQVVAEAERAFDQVDASLPYVKRRLAERLNDAERRHEELWMAHRLNPLVPPLTLDDAELAELQQLLADLPTLWRHPAVTADHRRAIVRTVIKAIYVTPRPDVWTLEIEWADGTRTRRELFTHHGVRAMITHAYKKEGRTPSEIVDLLAQRGIVHRTGPDAGAPYTEEAVRRLIRTMGLQDSFDQEAYACIRSRYQDGIQVRAIADELNARGIRHYLGTWTEHRVRVVIHRLRRGTVPGIEPLPHIPPLDERVRALNDEGLFPAEIATRLRAEGSLTNRRRPPTVNTVCQVLTRLHLRSNSAVQTERLHQHLKEWAQGMTVRELTQRANAVGCRTQRGNQWTENEMNRKLAAIGLRDPKKRGPYKKHLTPGKRAPQTDQAHRKEFDAGVRQDDVKQESGDVGSTASASDHR